MMTYFNRNDIDRATPKESLGPCDRCDREAAFSVEWSGSNRIYQLCGWCAAEDQLKWERHLSGVQAIQERRRTLTPVECLHRLGDASRGAEDALANFTRALDAYPTAQEVLDHHYRDDLAWSGTDIPEMWGTLNYPCIRDEEE